MKLLTYKSGKADALGVLAANEKEIYPLAALGYDFKEMLINCARGAIVDEQALAEALQNGTIAGAGLDVLSEEPINIHHPLFACDNAIITPHAAAFTEEAAFNLAQQSVMNILQFFDGKIPDTAINRKALNI